MIYSADQECTELAHDRACALKLRRNFGNRSKFCLWNDPEVSQFQPGGGAGPTGGRCLPQRSLTNIDLDMQEFSASGTIMAPQAWLTYSLIARRWNVPLAFRTRRIRGESF